MPKWKRQDETVCMPNTVCCAMASDGEEARLIVAAHNADIDALTAERDKWRNAVIDAAVVNWTYTAEDEDNPYLAVCKMVACAARDALDPQISLDAKALHDRIAELEEELAAAIEYAHAADAERDELQRRLDAVVAAIPMADLESGEVFCLDCNAITEPCALPDLQGDYCSECEEQVYSPFNDEEACAIYSKLRAIAEGREG